MSIDKQIHGDLEATTKGEMLAFSTDVKGSAAYVAMEQVTGTLQGRTGSFVLQHTATMNRSVPQLSITVVPDSGTGQLVGLTGKMDIQIADGKHSYTFDYDLPKAPEKVAVKQRSPRLRSVTPRQQKASCTSSIIRAWCQRFLNKLHLHSLLMPSASGGVHQQRSKYPFQASAAMRAQEPSTQSCHL
jgi:hypothetical protein